MKAKVKKSLREDPKFISMKKFLFDRGVYLKFIYNDHNGNNVIEFIFKDSDFD